MTILSAKGKIHQNKNNKECVHGPGGGHQHYFIQMVKESLTDKVDFEKDLK